MSHSDAIAEAFQKRTARLTLKKLLGLTFLGLLFPLHFVLTSDHFGPSEWGGMFWVVGMILWAVGFVGACVLYFGVVHLLRKFKGNES